VSEVIYIFFLLNVSRFPLILQRYILPRMVQIP